MTMRYLGGGVGHREEFYTIAHARAQVRRAPRRRARWEATNGARLSSLDVNHGDDDQGEDDEDAGERGSALRSGSPVEEVPEDEEAEVCAPVDDGEAEDDIVALEDLEDADEGARESDDDLQDFSAENFEHPEDDDEEDAYEDDEYACAGFARP